MTELLWKCAHDGIPVESLQFVLRRVARVLAAEGCDTRSIKTFLCDLAWNSVMAHPARPWTHSQLREIATQALKRRM